MMMVCRLAVLATLLLVLSTAQPALAMLPDDPPAPQQQAPQITSAVLPWCSIQPGHAGLLASTTAEDWTGWIAKLSGEQEMTVNGQPVTILTRYSTALFDGQSHGYNALREQILSWYPLSQVEEDPFLYQTYTWKNLVLTIPGTLYPDEVIMMTAHFDDMPGSIPAPGADDNGSGSATLLEAARILRSSPLPRTVRLVWFTGEEQGLVGSGAYTADHDLSNVIGVINLDMYAYDADNDRCFELHVGTMPSSNMIGQCIAKAITAYDLNLTFDYLTDTATTRSDHASFWRRGIGAVEVLENAFSHYQPNGCSGIDINPNYHRSGDTLANLNVQTAFDIHRAALAALFALAVPPDDLYFQYIPLLMNSEP